jgi:hypothetical protein
MGHSFCLQPWIQIGGNGNTVVQPAKNWADLAGYQDVAIYLEVSDVTLPAGITTTLNIQTAASQDESLMSNSGIVFPAAGTYTFQTAPAVTLGVQPLQVARFYPDTASVARFLRWSLTFGAAGTQITFRIWLNLNQAGW